MNKDLTVGNPTKVLWLFCMPLFGSIIFQQLYNIADSFVAGKFISENALAAVGNSYEITLIFIAFAFGCNIGCSVIVSQFFGAKRYADVKTTVYTSFIASGVICLILMAIGLFGCNSLLHLINTPSEIFADSALYLDIYIYGLPFVFFYNVSTGIFSALGDSKTPLYFLIGSSLGNILLDTIFVAVLTWGVAGVAWATFIAQGVACILALITLMGRIKGIETSQPCQIFSWQMLKKISGIAIPSILQQSFVSVGNIFIQSLVNSFGSSVIAGYSAAIKLNTFTITCFSTMGNAVSSFTAQNLGAGKVERTRKGLGAGIKMGLIVALPFFAAFFIFGKNMVQLFMSGDASVVALETGVTFLRIVSPFYFVISIKLLVDGLLRGAGAIREFMAATFTDLILRVLISYILSAFFQATGIWMSWPIGWTIAAIMSVFFYLKGKWAEKYC